MRSRRGQITLFVIIGLILLIVAALALSANQRVVNARLDAQAQSAVGEFIELNALNNYVGGCLNRITSDGLLLLGEQGGVIYESQGGLTPIYESLEGIGYLPHTFIRPYITSKNQEILEPVNRNISYSISPRVDCARFKGPFISFLEYELTSYYPVKEVYFSDYVKTFRQHYTNGGCSGYFEKPYVSQSGFLGANNFPKLCSYNGSNKFDPFARIPPCKPEQYDSIYSNPSMQRQLEFYIKNKISTCVNLSSYEKYSSMKISVDEKKVFVNTTILRPRGISIEAHYPLTVQIEGRASVQQASFQTELNTNVRQLYNYVSRLLLDHVRDPNFIFLEDWNNSAKNPYYKETFELFYYQAPCLYCNKDSTRLDYVLTIVDHSSLLKGRPWTIMTGLKQRNPVLDYMNDPGQDTYFNGEKVDYQFFANATARLVPYGVDPDGGSLTYEYHDWKEDYDEQLNWTCCEEESNIACDLSDYHLCLNPRVDDDLHLWSSSSEFQETQRSASFNTSYGDVGLHNVTVVITDNRGNQDFQIIRILVFDLPQAKLNVSNPYSDIDNSWASVEDPFILDGSASIASIMAGGDISSYIFQDDEEPFIFMTNKSIVNLSNVFWNATLDYFMYNNFDPSEDYIDHSIYLYVRQNETGVTIQSPPALKNVSVAQCLPHGYVGDLSPSSFNPMTDYDVDIYENGGYYYGHSENLFDAPHVCCIPFNMNPYDATGGTYAPEETICFQKDFRTCFPDRNLDNPYVYLDGALLDQNNAGGVYTVDYNASYFSQSVYGSFFNKNFRLNAEVINDVFAVDFEQYCSGVRGNTCGGDIDADWNKIECNDLNDNINQFARCQGPGVDNSPIDYFDCMNKDMTEDLICVNYSSRHSFELDSFGYIKLDEDGSWSDEELDLIEEGYCAPPTLADISLTGDVITHGGYNSNTNNPPSWPYTCQATCNPDDGECAYWKLEYCKCERGNTCDALPASVFEPFTNSERYYCKASTTCDTSCQANSNNEAECYCAKNLDGGYSFSSVEMSSNEFYFANSYSPIGSGSCCVSGAVILGSNSVCYKGDIHDYDVPFGSGNPLIACDNYIYFCCDGSSCTAPETYIFSIPSGSDRCESTCDDGEWV